MALHHYRATYQSVTTPWDTLLIRSAHRSISLNETEHLSFSSHINSEVRISWSTREDIPVKIAVRRALSETDTNVLRTMIENRHIPVEAISVIAEHHPNREIALFAALSGRCPDEIASQVLIGRLRSLVRGSYSLSPFDLKERPLVAASLGWILPADYLIHFASSATLCTLARKEAIAVIKRRIHGCDELFAKRAVVALMILDAETDQKLRNIATRKGGVLQAWVDLHDGTGDNCTRRLILNDSHFFGSNHAYLLLKRAVVEDNLEVISHLTYNKNIDIDLLASHITTLPNVKDLLETNSWIWTPSLVNLLGDHMLAILESDSSQILSKVHDSETLAALAKKCQSIRVYRLIAAHPSCTVQLAITLPASAALEAYHDPGLLLQWVTTNIGSAGDAASTLSMDFSGSLNNLVEVAKRLIRG